jgi:hypothetical protein
MNNFLSKDKYSTILDLIFVVDIFNLSLNCFASFVKDLKISCFNTDMLNHIYKTEAINLILSKGDKVE